MGAFLKKAVTKSSGTSNSRTPSRMPSEMVQVIRYEDNEIIARRMKNGEEVRIAFAQLKNPPSKPRPEVAHLTGKIKKPRDMTAPAGSILKIDRDNVTEDMTDGKMMISWVSVWSRNPEEELVFKANASITFLKESDKVREDGTKSYKGLLTIVMDETFSDYSDGRLGKDLWKGHSPAMAADAGELSKAIESLAAAGLSTGVRMCMQGDNGPDTDAVVLYAKYGVEPSKIASDFIASIQGNGIAERIGQDIQCEVIPVFSMTIGNDTAAALSTGVNGEGKPSPMAFVRKSFQGTVTDNGNDRTIPRFMSAYVLARTRNAQSSGPYLSVENLSPNFSGKPALGISEAILAAKTQNSALFQVLAQPQPESAPAASAPAPAAPAAASVEPAAPSASTQEASSGAADDDLDPFGGDSPSLDGFTQDTGSFSEDDFEGLFGDDSDDAPRPGMKA